MTGIFGIAYKDNSCEAVNSDLNRIANSMNPDDQFGLDLHHDQHFGFGKVGARLQFKDPQPIWNDKKTLCLVMEGEIFDCEPLRKYLQSQGYNFITNSEGELILHAYENFGDQFVNELNGAFAVAIWDQPANKLILANDHLGLCPIYLAQTEKGLVFASKLHDLLSLQEVDRAIDPQAIAQFLTFNHILGNRTLLKNAALLPPASILTFQNGNLTEFNYWKLEFSDPYQPCNENDCLEELYYYLRQAVSRQTQDDLPAGILLSGGLDSRILLGLLKEEPRNKALHSFTWGILDCDDAKSAKELALRTNTQHHFFELSPNYIPEKVVEGVRITDGGNCIDMHSLANLSSQSKLAKVIYKGYFGDALLGSMYLRRTMLANYNPEELAQLLFDQNPLFYPILFDQAGREELFSEQFLSNISQVDLVKPQEFISLSNSTIAADQINHFNLHQRQRRLTLKGVELVRSQVIVRTPFCDKDLVNFMLTIPPGLRMDRYLQIQLLIQKFPELAQIPFARTGQPLMNCARDIVIQTERLIKWHMHSIGFAQTPTPKRRPYADYNGWMRKELLEWVKTVLLDQRTLDRGYYKPKYIQQLIDDHITGANHAIRLGALISLELWHREFLD